MKTLVFLWLLGNSGIIWFNSSLNFSIMKNLKQFLRPNFFSIIAVGFAIYAFAPNMELRSVSVAVDKMNVFYIGVDNPITVAVEGIPDEVVQLHSDQVKLVKVGQGKYNVTASKPGIAKLLVYGDGFEPQDLEFRVKRIPDPLASLKMENGTLQLDSDLPAENFKKAIGLGIMMENFNFDFSATISSYHIVKVPLGGKQVELESTSTDGSFNAAIKTLIDAASPGDTYYFTEVKGKFPGSMNAWKLNSLVFHIK